MSALDAYSPLWPETTVFIGAGATAALGMPMTSDLGKFFRDLAKANSHKERRKLLWDKKRDFLSETRQPLLDLIDLLAAGDDRLPRLASITSHQAKILKRLYPKLKREQRLETVISLRRYYSWDSLIRVIRSTPNCDNTGDFLRDLFNLLDMHIQTNSGLPVCGGPSASDGHNTEGKFLQNEGLCSARDCLILFTSLLFACAYQKTRKEPAQYAPYVKAARAFAKMMQDEGLGLKNSKLNNPIFYLHSTAFISMNFDPLFISLLLSANDEANRKRRISLSTNRVKEPLKVALDLGHLWCVRPVTGNLRKIAGMWYPFNESVAQRLNDPDYNTGRRVRIAKFYFPHGNTNSRLCPNCGKTSLHLGENWRFPDGMLFPPSVIKGLDWNYRARSKNERNWRETRGHRDALQCFYCGHRTGARDNTMIMQTSFKGAYSPAIAETQSEIRALLEKTSHIVLLGYSLPKDDVIWRAFLAARRNGRDLHCTVVVGVNPKETRWLTGTTLESYLDLKKADATKGGRDAILSAREVFGKDNVRAYIGGIPSVFTISGEIGESMRQLLYPEDWGPAFPHNWWKRRVN